MSIERMEWNDLCRHDRSRVLLEAYAMVEGESDWSNLKPHHLLALHAVAHGTVHIEEE